MIAITSTPQLRARISVIGGIVFQEGFLGSRGRVSWPFARFVASASTITLTPRGFLIYLRRPTVFEIGDVTEAIVIAPPRLLRFGAALEFRSTKSEVDGICFAASTRNLERIRDFLSERGVNIVA